MFLASVHLNSGRPLSLAASKWLKTEHMREVIEEAFRNYYGRGLVLQEVHGVDISHGNDFLSVVTLYALKWADKNDSHGQNGNNHALEDVPDTVVVKVPNQKLFEEAFKDVELEPAVQETLFNLEWIAEAHNNECLIYSMFGRKPPVPVPICYTFLEETRTESGMLVLENMKESGVIFQDMSVTLSLGQIYRIAEVIANLQAWSLTSVSSKLKKKLLNLQRLVISLLDLGPTLKHQGVMWSKKFLEEFGADIDVDLVERTISEQYLLQEEQEYKQHMLPTVIVHGDLWAHNVVFEVTPVGKAGDNIEGVIDWHMSHMGACVEDLAQVMVWSVSPEIRHAETANILRHFFHALLRANNTPVSLSFEHVKRAYNGFFVMSTMFLIFRCKGLVERLLKPKSHTAERKRREFGMRLASCYEDSVKILRSRRDEKL